MFGHVDAPPHWVAHLRRLARIQQDTGGFTEFVPLPFIHRNAPIYLAGHARPGPSFEDSVRMHAVARILLDGVIHNVQVSWVKLGVEASSEILRVGGERLRRHVDGRDDQPDGGRRMGDTDDAGGVRRRDPRDRQNTRRADDDVRSDRDESRFLTPNTSGYLTVMVIPIDYRVSSPKGLHSSFCLGTITSDEGRGRESPEIPSCQGGGSSLRITRM